MTYAHDVSATRERLSAFRRNQRAVARGRRDYDRIVAAKVAARNAPEVVMKKSIISAWRKARAGAKRRSIAFAISIEDVIKCAAANDYRCELTGLPMSLDRTPGWYHRPFAPSVDRKDSAKGYTRSNVRVVCHAVNMALGEWGEVVFRAVAKGYAARNFGHAPGILATSEK